jgi:putative FmdB family regulatory protein
MPLYDFHCTDCDRTFELLVRLSDTPTCPECQGQNLQKQVSRPAAPGQTAGILAKARSQAAREGHFSNYKRSERPRSR